MKIGVSSYSFLKYIKNEKCDYFKICDIAKEIGFDGIEFIDLDFSEFKITDDSLTMAAELKKYCKGIGLDIAAYTVGANFLKEDLAGEVKRLKKCVDVAKKLGAPTMRFDICWSLRKEYLYGYEDAINEFAPFICQVADYAEKKGIRVCTENHGQIFQAPERMEKLIKTVNHKNFGWLCDMGNFLCVDADPVKSCAIAAPYAFHVHTKDFLFKPCSSIKPEGFMETAQGNFIRGTVIGHGVVPVEQCVKILKKSGYDGWVSVEFEGMEENIPAIKSGFNFLKNII